MRKYVDEWLESLTLDKGLSPNTYKSYKSGINLFLQYCEKNEITELNQVNREIVQGWFRKMYKLKANTINQRKNMLNTFCKWLIKNEIHDDNFSRWIEFKRIQKKTPIYLTKEEAIKAIEQSTISEHPFFSARDKFMINFFIKTGLRISEVINLQEKHIANNVITVKQGKGNKDRVVPLSTSLQVELENYLKVKKENGYDNKFLFVTKNRGQFSYSGMKKVLDLVFGRIDRDDLTPHKLRATFATLLYESDVAGETVQELLGHESFNTTKRYLNMSKSKEKAVNVLDF